MNTSLTAERPAHVPADRVIDFDMYAPPGVASGFHEAWEKLHAPGIPDIVWTPQNGGHWIVTCGKLIAQVIGDYERFSNRVNGVPKAIFENLNMLPTTIDPPEHRPYRILLNSSFAPKAVGGMESRIRELAGALIEKVQADGQCNFTTAYAEIFPIHIFMSMVELPLSDAEKLKYWADQLIRPDGSMTFDEAKRHIYDYMAPYVDARAGGNGQDLLSRMINGRVEDRLMTKQEMLDLSCQVMIAGLDTVVNFLGFAMLYLARNPEHRRELVANPGLIPAAVDELFRRLPLVALGREVRGDMEFEGLQLKKGDMVILPTMLSGTDGQVNARPLEVDFHRPAAEHATFGNGPHRCPGAHLARTEVRITLEEWLARIPQFEVAPGAEISFRGGIVGVVNALPLVWNVVAG